MCVYVFIGECDKIFRSLAGSLLQSLLVEIAYLYTVCVTVVIHSLNTARAQRLQVMWPIWRAWAWGRHNSTTDTRNISHWQRVLTHDTFNVSSVKMKGDSFLLEG